MKNFKEIYKLQNCLMALFILFIINLYSNTHSVETFSSNETLIFSKGSKYDKVISISFDDGPHPEYTNEILDILKTYNIKATFFVLGLHAEKYPDVIQRIVDEGHEIGNHSYSHIDMKKSNKKLIKSELEKTQNIIYSITNIKPTVFRPPYGNYNQNVLDEANLSNLQLILWTYYQDSKDWSNPGVEVIVNTTLSNIQNGDIILFHDYIYKKESHTVDALKIIIPDLLNDGFNFVTISELMSISQERKASNTFQ